MDAVGFESWYWPQYCVSNNQVLYTSLQVVGDECYILSWIWIFDGILMEYEENFQKWPEEKYHMSLLGTGTLVSIN
jgi:hypothetical protein